MRYKVLVPTLFATFIVLFALGACSSAFVVGLAQGLSNSYTKNTAIKNAKHGIDHDFKKQDRIINSADECEKRLPKIPRKGFGLEHNKLTWEHMTDNSYATSSDRKTIAERMGLYPSCGNQFFATHWASFQTISNANIVENVITHELLLAADLYNGEITWGQYNKEIKRITVEMVSGLRAITAETQRRVNSSASQALNSLRVNQLNNEIYALRQQQLSIMRNMSSKPQIVFIPDGYYRYVSDGIGCRDPQGFYRIGRGSC